MDQENEGLLSSFHCLQAEVLILSYPEGQTIPEMDTVIPA
jgi:hypothetical protein